MLELQVVGQGVLLVGIPPGTPPPGGPPPGAPPPGPPEPPGAPSFGMLPPGSPIHFIPFWNFVAMLADDEIVVFEAALGMVVIWVVVVVVIAILASASCSGMSGCTGLFLICWSIGSSLLSSDKFCVLICTGVSGSSSPTVNVSSRLTSCKAACNGSSSLL